MARSWRAYADLLRFDKALVLYEGRQIFFGKTTEAKQYFENMGFKCPDRQTDADFLTSMTSVSTSHLRSHSTCDGSEVIFEALKINS